MSYKFADIKVANNERLLIGNSTLIEVGLKMFALVRDIIIICYI